MKAAACSRAARDESWLWEYGAVGELACAEPTSGLSVAEGGGFDPGGVDGSGTCDAGSCLSKLVEGASVGAGGGLGGDGAGGSTSAGIAEAAAGGCGTGGPSIGRETCLEGASVGAGGGLGGDGAGGSTSAGIAEAAAGGCGTGGPSIGRETCLERTASSWSCIGSASADGGGGDWAILTGGGSFSATGIGITRDTLASAIGSRKPWPTLRSASGADALAIACFESAGD
jgi:hypothetical protein